MNRRHELNKNELGDWLEHKIEDLRPYFPIIGIGTLAVVGLVVLGWWYTGERANASASVWNQYFSAIGERDQEEALEKVITDEAGTAAAFWARQSLADMNLSRGAALMFSDREEANKRLTEAEENYRAILEKATEPMLVARANFGLARTLESLCKPKDALEIYKKLADAEKNSALGKAATESVERLSDARDVEMLAWFAEQKPTRPAPTPGPGMGPQALPNDLPDRPDLGLPGLDLGTPGTPPATPGLSLPAPATGETSDAEKAAAEKSDTGDKAGKSDAEKSDAPKSTDEKSADDKPADAPKSDAAKSDETKTDAAPKTDSDPPPSSDDAKKDAPADSAADKKSE